MTSTLAPGTYTLPAGTTIVVPEPATVAPPAPVLGPGTISQGGVFGPGFAGDSWSASGATIVNGPDAITVYCLSQWAEWIANATTSNGINGNFPLIGYTELVVSLTPRNPGFTWQIVIVPPCLNPNVVDALCEGNPITDPVLIDAAGTYGPAPTVGVSAEYIIPLAALGGKPGARKVAIQVQGPNGAGTSFDIDYSYFR
jgi:hypothetical protein